VVRDESAIKRSWKLFCQSAQQQANALLRFEALTEEHDNLVYAHESCKDMKVRYKESKKELSSLQSAFDEEVSSYGRLSKDYDAVLAQEKGWDKYVVECGNGEMVRRMIINELLLCVGCTRALNTNGHWERPSALLLAKVARAYLLDLSELQNVMPDETGPMPEGD
ncbi:hypothetical protein Tco_1074009, partial [Tanacetum coccineum]